MADVALAVRVSANLDAMRAAMKDAQAMVDTTSGAMKAMANAYDGTRTIANANAAMLQVQALGGVTKLTEGEQARLNTTLQAGIDKYAALGQTAPAGMQALADATKQTADTWGEFVNKFDIKAAIADPLGTAQEGMKAFAGTLGETGIAMAGAAVAIARSGAPCSSWRRAQPRRARAC
jgi:hypothetical protein